MSTEATVVRLFCPACRCPKCGAENAVATTGDPDVHCENGHLWPEHAHAPNCPRRGAFDCPGCGSRLEATFSYPPVRPVDGPFVVSVEPHCPNGCF